MELEAGNFSEAEAIFARCLMEVPHVGVWTKYLDYIRRRNPINEGASQRQTVGESFKFVIDNIGLDKDSGKIWADYIHFLKAAPGKVGGSDWQDQQKMDQLRKAYHQATSVPIENINTLWKEYDQFEMNLNKITGRKFLSDRSPSYMSAKSAVTALKNITQGLHRTNIPRLPPAPGFEGDQEFAEQVEIWKRWIAWEKTDPLEIKDEQPDAYQKRVKYVYNQALMALRFWPEMWADAAQWCLDENIMDKDKNQPAALDYLDRGIQANPESVLLALKHGDYIESTHPVQDTEEGKIERGQAVRQPFQRVLETLYASIKTVKDREAAMIAKIEEAAAAELGALPEKETEEDDEYNAAYEQEDREKLKKVQIDAVQKGNNAQIQLLSRTISFVWIALMRAMRRIQGKGDPKSPLGGMRAIFQEARQKGRLTSEVYVASALMEWTIYKDKVGGKIFERGAKLFPEDDNYNLEYIKYLHSTDDFTSEFGLPSLSSRPCLQTNKLDLDARVLFETFVNRLTQDPKKVHQTKTLYAYFHKWESQYGEHAQVMKLEQRMAELFPEDPKLTLFNKRFATDKFDPIAARIIISPTTQLRPKSSVVPSIEPITSRPISPAPLPYVPSPHPGLLQVAQSPKRPFPVEDFEDANPPRKMMRGEESQRGVSPLKGAAGRRLDQQRRMQGHGPGSSYTAAPRPISRDITFLLNIIPSPDLYRGPHFDRHMVVYTLQTTRVPNEGFSTAMRGAHAPSHARHVSNDVGGRRNSPMPGYRQSPQRPGSSGSYEPPPPAGMAQLAQQAAMGYPAVGQFDQGAWQQQLGSTPMYATPGQAQGNAASRQPYQGYQQY